MTISRTACTTALWLTQLDDPAPWMVAGEFPLLPLFLPSGPNMRDVIMLLGDLATRIIIMALVQTHMLRRFLRGLWPLHYDRVQGIRQQLHVVPIGSCHDHRKGNALPLRQHTALRPALATVRGIGARGLCPKGALVMAPSTLCQVHSNPLRSS
jgi:hypothetical protein